MGNMNEVVGDNKPKLPPHLQKLVTEGKMSYSDAMQVLQEQNKAPRVLLEG
jgi:hypothetical protein